MIRVNAKQVRRVAEFLKAHPPKDETFNFYSVQTPKGELALDTLYPSLNHPQAIDFFFFTVLHDFGFWYGDERGYVQPLYGHVAGKRLKGSDLLWTLFVRQFKANPHAFEPGFLADVQPDVFGTMFFRDDAGTQWPDFEARFQATRGYGRWLVEHEMTPSGIVQFANGTSEPLEWFLLTVGQVFGYHLDMHEKRQLLLAMVLANRPERFLNVTDPEHWMPIVDYHIMRLCLRLGLVCADTEEREILTGRLWADEELESEIRTASFDAVELLIQKSVLPMPLLDAALWMGRTYCPEMTPPECPKCVFDTVCAKRTELFQPVLRTTAY